MPILTTHDPDKAGEQFEAALAMEAHPANIALAVDGEFGGIVLIQGDHYVRFGTWESMLQLAKQIDGCKDKPTAVVLRQGECAVIVPPIPEAIASLIEMLRDTGEKWKAGKLDVKPMRTS